MNYIIYEDSHICVCHKPSGLAVQNASFGRKDLESILKTYYFEQTGKSNPYLGIVHRLDQPVEGVLVFALNGKAAAELNRQMTSGGIEKIYLAVTAGHITQEKAVLEDWLKKDNRTNSSAVVPAGTAGAKKAVLSYEVIEQKETGNKTGGEAVREGQEAEPTEIRSLLRIHLDTGRHHQIRVQMAHAGMALVGDKKYNYDKEENGQEPLALCSAKLGFRHPVTKKKMEFQVVPTGSAFRIFHTGL